MKSNTRVNIVSSVLMQFSTIVCGFIIPHLILEKFGSNINGAVSSITQFLSYISLIEGGVGGVVIASLYKPLYEKDDRKINMIVNAASAFFKRIATIYAVYLIILACTYGLFIKDFSWEFFFSLTLILGINTLAQYYFSISYRLLLQADRKIWVNSFVRIIALYLNLILIVLFIKYIQSIQILKLVTSIAFLIQPIIIIIYTKKHYTLDSELKPEKNILSQRWDGFGQNLAYFIHMNTDVVILTIFSSLADVSVYSVYYLVASGLTNFVIAISDGIRPTMGKMLAIGNLKKSNDFFEEYSFIMNVISIIAFSCCVILIVPFAMLYTKSLSDADYYRPLFGAIISIACFLQCIREPYKITIYSAGHYKQSNRNAYFEAICNVVISLILVQRYSILGVAIGTLVAMGVRQIAFAKYLSKAILYRNMKKTFLDLLVTVGTFCFIVIVLKMFTVNYVIDSISKWILCGIFCVFVSSFIVICSSLLFKRKIFFSTLLKVFNK